MFLIQLFFLSACSNGKGQGEPSLGFDSIATELQRISETSDHVARSLSLCKINSPFWQAGQTFNMEPKIECEIADDISLVEASLRELEIIEMYIQSLSSKSQKTFWSENLRIEKNRLNERRELLKNGDSYFDQTWSESNLKTLGCQLTEVTNTFQNSTKDKWECTPPQGSEIAQHSSESRFGFLTEREQELSRSIFWSNAESKILPFRLTHEKRSQIEQLKKELFGLVNYSPAPTDLESLFNSYNIDIKLPLDPKTRERFIQFLDKLSQNTELLQTFRDIFPEAFPHAAKIIVFQVEILSNNSLFEIDIQQGIPQLVFSINESEMEKIVYKLNMFKARVDQVGRILKLNLRLPFSINAKLQILLNNSEDSLAFDDFEKKLNALRLLQPLFTKIQEEKRLAIEVSIQEESYRESKIEIYRKEDRLTINVDGTWLGVALSSDDFFQTQFEVNEALRLYESKGELETLSPSLESPSS